MKSLKKIFVCFIVMLVSVSCVQDLDFNQIDDFSIDPVFEGSLIGFTVTQRQFFNEAGMQETELTNVSDFFVFENDFIRTNLVRAEFTVAIENAISQEFSFQVDFLDQNSNVIYSFNEIVVEANNTNFMFMEVVDIETNATIINTRQIRITARVNSSNPSLDPSDTSELIFKSSAKIFIQTNG